MLFWPIFNHFWFPVVTLVTFSSNLSNFQKNPKKNPKKIFKKSKKNPKFQKILKFQKISKNPRKFQDNWTIKKIPPPSKIFFYDQKKVIKK